MCLCCLATLTRVCAQKWASPEQEQMFAQANRNMTAKNYAAAITAYDHLSKIAPQNQIVFIYLADAYLQSGDAGNAKKVLSSFSPTDITCVELYFCTYSDALQARQSFGKAIRLLESALLRYPSLGSLYHRLGNLYAVRKKDRKALETWTTGILKAPAYALNYRQAASALLRSRNWVQGLILGEMYLNMDTTLTGNEEIKASLWHGYKELFINPANLVKKDGDNDFYTTVTTSYADLFPVVAEGITTESLTMLHTRFVMSWLATHHVQSPFSLFSYYNNMIREGYFDIYHEWLFGNAESPVEYNNWKTFHKGDIERFMQWKKQNRYLISPKDSQLFFSKSHE